MKTCCARAMEEAPNSRHACTHAAVQDLFVDAERQRLEGLVIKHYASKYGQSSVLRFHFVSKACMRFCSRKAGGVSVPLPVRALTFVPLSSRLCRTRTQMPHSRSACALAYTHICPPPLSPLCRTQTNKHFSWVHHGTGEEGAVAEAQVLGSTSVLMCARIITFVNFRPAPLPHTPGTLWGREGRDCG